MLKRRFKATAQDEKIVDVNDYWLIQDNPMTKIGVFPYLGRQISPKLEPYKVYQVLRPKEELTKPETLKSLELIPLTNDHTMIGTEPGMQPAEKVGVEGVTGANVKVNDKLITNDLKCYTENIKDLISSGKKDLSMGYRCRYELSSGEFEGEYYDAIQRDIIFNHIALVDEGRMGKDVQVMDSRITFDTLSEILKQKEKNKMAEEKPKVNAAAEDEEVDKRKLIDEVGGILKDKVDEETWRTIIGKIEKGMYNKSEAGGNDEDVTDPKELKGEDEEEVIVEEHSEEGTEALKEEIKEEIKEELKDAIAGMEASETAMDSMVKMFAKRDDLISRVRPIIGDNVKYSTMTHKELVKYACDKLDIKPSVDTLEGYLKANSKFANVRVSLDSVIATGKSKVLQEYLK